MKKFAKILIIILLVLAVIYGILIAISPAQLKLDESENINAPSTMIYNVVNNLKGWEDWSPWAEMDPTAKNSYSDKTSGVGAIWNWDGEKLGKGSQKIIETVIGEKIKTDLEFEGAGTPNYSTWTFNQTGEQTKVTWDFEGADTPLFFRPFNLFMKGSLKKTYKQGLKSLKEMVEKRAKEKIYRGFKVREVDMPEKSYIMNRSVVNMENIQQFYTQSLGALFGKVQGANIEMDGTPSGLFFKWDEVAGTADMATGIPIKDAINVKGASSLTIPEGKALQVDYYGDYSKTAEAHYALDDYMKDYNLINNTPVVEEYVTSEEKDPSKWLTKITYYLSCN